MCDGSNKNEALQIKTVGETPDFEVRLIPSWIIFTATDNYRTPQCARFKVNIFSEFEKKFFFKILL